MANDERTEGTWDEGKGNVKETAGEVQGNESQRREGQLDQAKGKAKQGIADLKDTAAEAGDNIEDATRR